LQYGASEGDNILKDQLMKWEGYELNPAEMLITTGATNAIYYYTRTLINPGDVIICEAPSFLGSLVAFEAAGAEVIGVPLDQEGLSLNALQVVVDKLEQTNRRVKFIYTIPDFHNPSGITMSLPRRKALLEYCLAKEIPLLEDNPYSRLRYSGEPLPTLYRIARGEYQNRSIVTEVVSFSKILGPGMRIAYAKGDMILIERMCSWQQKVNITSDGVSQRVAARFLSEGHMQAHITSICEFYKPYLDKMLTSMAKHLPPFIQYTKPQGGIFTWLWLPEDMSADVLFEKAKQHKVSFIPGSKFYPSRQEKFNSLRLNFTFSSFEQIEVGMQRLGNLMNEFYA
jgi:2-aminoadipate transaminase